MNNKKNKFTAQINNKKSAEDLYHYLIKKKVGDEIPSEKCLEDIIGYSLSSTREALITLECYGYISRVHGKKTIALQNFADDPISDLEDIYKKQLSSDSDFNCFVNFIDSKVVVGASISGERPLKKALNLGREKIREFLLKLECFGYVKCLHGKKRTLIKALFNHLSTISVDK